MSKIESKIHAKSRVTGIDGAKRLLGNCSHRRSQTVLPCLPAFFRAQDAERLAQQKVRIEVSYDPGKVDLEPEARTS